MLLGLLPMTGVAQRGYTMNFLNLIPQQNKFNPAYDVRYSTYIGIPIVSNIQFQINNDMFSIDRMFLPLDDDGNRNLDPLGIIAVASENSNLGVDVSMDIFSFGFKFREKNQIHVGLGVDAYANILFTKNTLGFILNGPGVFIGQDESDALSGNYFDVNAYVALSLGYSREVNENFRVGGRVKFLSGLANIYTERSNVRISIDDGDPDITPYTYTVKPDVILKTSVPKNDMLPALTKNLGFGFDFGAVYKVSDELTLSASVYDIGFINWKTDVERIISERQEKPFVFSGVEQIDDIFNNEELDVTSILTSLKDSLFDFFQLNEIDSTFTSYRSSLRTSYNLSLFYNFTDHDQIGLMWNSRLGKRKYNALTIAYTRAIGRNFQFCINNAIINDNFFNFGGGFAVNAGPIQFYLIADKISSIHVIKMRAINVQFGLNLVFNRKKERNFTPRDRTGYVNDRWFI
jgi:hypothetical protein